MVKVNMMCGGRFFGPDWFHVDMANLPHVSSKDIRLLNWAEDSIDLIYCSHGIAYFDRQELEGLLNNWRCALKSGGVLRIATPDLHKIGWMLSNRLCTLQEVLGPIYGKMQVNGQEIGHKMGYDYPTLKGMLEAAGFGSVDLYDHRFTEHPNSGDRADVYDDHSAAYVNGELISLNIQGTKI